MSTLERDPSEIELRCLELPGPVTRVIAERRVPLGGPRGMIVTRTIPERSLPTVGPWCFFDEAGPVEHLSRLLPHPHIGLQTVSWLVEGAIVHRDTTGAAATILPGQLNVMTSGRGIVHSEFTPGEEALRTHLLQLWIALPESARWQAPHFEQHSDLPTAVGAGWSATVLFGEFAGAVSPAAHYSPIVGAEVRINAGATARLALRPDFEHAVLAARGAIQVDGQTLGSGPLLYLGGGREELDITAGADGATVMLIGGEPLGEDLVMWWNFVGRSHDEIREARDDWEDDTRRETRYGPAIDIHEGARIPAPPLPNVRLTPRIRRPEPGTIA
ncbi:MAG TPA: pirin family protein [Microbacteriaceae bacterium]|nr:pirin family protein [Microbacteriaceae bacterium]